MVSSSGDKSLSNHGAVGVFASSSLSDSVVSCFLRLIGVQSIVVSESHETIKVA